jgi:cytokinin dehydrogenase
VPQVFDDLPELAGTFDTDEKSLSWASQDYGGVVRHLPAAVLRPATAVDVCAVVRHAGQHGLHVVPRGQGHSTGGQAQSLGGVVVDITSSAASTRSAPITWSSTRVRGGATSCA